MWTTSEDDAPTMVDWLMRTTVIENGLLQYWQLRILNDLPEDKNFEKRSIELQQKLIFGLAEHGQSALIYGSAGDIASAVVSRLGGEALRMRVMEKAELLRELVTGERAKRAAARSTRLAAAVLLAVIIFALPTIRDGIKILDTASRGLLTTSVSVEILAVSVYGAFIGGALIAMIFTLPRRLQASFRKASAKRVGMRWPGKQFMVRLERKQDR